MIDLVAESRIDRRDNAPGNLQFLGLKHQARAWKNVRDLPGDEDVDLVLIRCKIKLSVQLAGAYQILPAGRYTHVVLL